MANIDWSNFFESLVKYGGIAGGLFGFYKSFTEYRNAQKWKKAEFLAKEAKEFFADKNVSRCLIFLDYNDNHIPIYENELESEKILHYNNDFLMKALDPDRAIKEFSKEEAFVRKIFDDFLTKIGFFNNYIETKLITVKDLKPYLGYWMTTLASPKDSKRNKQLMSRIWKFIDTYNHEDVKKLASHFGFSPDFEITVINNVTPPKNNLKKSEKSK